LLTRGIVDIPSLGSIFGAAKALGSKNGIVVNGRIVQKRIIAIEESRPCGTCDRDRGAPLL
jgi:hypothetical protein